VVQAVMVEVVQAPLQTITMAETPRPILAVAEVVLLNISLQSLVVTEPLESLLFPMQANKNLVAERSLLQEPVTLSTHLPVREHYFIIMAQLHILCNI
jgi:hypothetical protein